MPKNKVEEIRQKLNSLIASDNVSKEELQLVSEELDDAILQYMNEQRSSSSAARRSTYNGDSLEEIIQKVLVFGKLYEVFRIVDPVKKKVYEYIENRRIESDFICYDFWKREAFCENCISMRAYNHDDVFVKIESKDGNTYLITAIPVMVGNQRLILELLKNISSNMFIENCHYNNEYKE